MNSVARANGMSVLQLPMTHDIGLAPAGSFVLTRAFADPHDGRPLFALSLMSTPKQAVDHASTAMEDVPGTTWPITRADG